MKYYYVFKTSDGVRTQESIEAVSRDEAFASLRRKGIRPIKVVAADGAKANGEVRGVRKRVVTLLVLVSVVLTAVMVAVLVRRNIHDPAKDPAIVRFVSTMESAVVEYGFSYASLGLSAVDDYAAIAKGADIGPMLERIRNGERLIDSTKNAFRVAFEECTSSVGRDSEAYRYAETLLRARVVDFNSQRTTLANRVIMLSLLHDNLGKWKVSEAGLIFEDKNLERTFKYCQGSGD